MLGVSCCAPAHGRSDALEFGLVHGSRCPRHHAPPSRTASRIVLPTLQYRIWNVSRSLYAFRGVRGFWRGLGPTAMRVVPGGGAVQFCCSRACCICSLAFAAFFSRFQGDSVVVLAPPDIALLMFQPPNMPSRLLGIYFGILEALGGRSRAGDGRGGESFLRAFSVSATARGVVTVRCPSFQPCAHLNNSFRTTSFFCFQLGCLTGALVSCHACKDAV
jgi:transmembrane carrier protein